MQLGMVGLGRMGSNLVRRLVRDGHRCVVYDVNPDAVARARGATASSPPRRSRTSSAKLERPRADLAHAARRRSPRATLDELASTLDPTTSSSTAATPTTKTTSTRRAQLAERGVHYVDCGTSGGVWGLERGYSLMIGGEDDVVARLDPIFASIAPGDDGIAADARSHARRRHGAEGLPALRTQRRRPLRQDGPQRHRVRHDGRDRRGPQHPQARQRRHDRRSPPTPRPRPCATPSTTPTTSTSPRSPRCGATARSSAPGWSTSPPTPSRARPSSPSTRGRVSDSGEGRWTVEAAIDESVPAPVISAALWQRYESRGAGRVHGQGALGDARGLRRARGEALVSAPRAARLRRRRRARRGRRRVRRQRSRRARAGKGRFTFAVSGGRTPVAHVRPARRGDVPWDHTRIFQVDERVVPRR